MLHLATITAPFFSALAELGEFEPIDAADMPPEYQALLAHEHHMTVTVEQFHGAEVDVRVLAEDRDGDVYSRTSLLVCLSSDRVVQFGVMRINLRGLSSEVRGEIESRRVPLGRTLIRHNVLRRVELQRLWRIWPGAVLTKYLTVPVASTVGNTTQHAVVTQQVAKLAQSNGRDYTSAPSEISVELNQDNCVYGRSAGIIVEGRPTVELLEIVSV